MIVRPQHAAAVAPRGSWSRAAVVSLGMDVERLEQAAATHHRAGVAAALAGVRTRATTRNPDGISRGALILRCGRRHAWKIGAAIELQPVCCRQRPCPACARVRARDNANDVRAAMRARRAADGGAFVFATFTQRKLPRWHESPRGAVDRIVQTWRTITNSRTATGRAFAERFAGGLRSTECTYAAKGDEREHGGRVEYTGYHAHLHVLLEVRAGVDRAEAAGWLLRQWLRASAGASPAAQVIRPLKLDEVTDAHQLCKYVTKPLEDNVARPAVLRELFGALHGVRMLEAFGEWRASALRGRVGWRALADADAAVGPKVPRWRGPEIGDLLRYTVKRPEGSTDRMPFVGMQPDDVVWISAAEAWAQIERAAAAQRAAARAGPG